jgi:hypothetical protein
LHLATRNPHALTTQIDAVELLRPGEQGSVAAMLHVAHDPCRHALGFCVAGLARAH